MPRMLYEFIVEACDETEQNTKKELRRTKAVYRITVTSSKGIDGAHDAAQDALRGRLLFYLRTLGFQRLRKASSREHEMFKQIDLVEMLSNP
jgi:hypothetical protein